MSMRRRWSWRGKSINDYSKDVFSALGSVGNSAGKLRRPRQPKTRVGHPKRAVVCFPAGFVPLILICFARGLRVRPFGLAPSRLSSAVLSCPRPDREPALGVRHCSGLCLSPASAAASSSASVNSPAQYCFSVEVIFNHFTLAARSTDG